MFKYWKKICSIAIATTLITGIVVGAETVGVEKHLEGGGVLLEQYCRDVAEGTLEPKPAESLAATQGTEVADATEQPENVEEAEETHVELNLNYSRLGVANKVDTYLNVRNKPSEKGKIVGKMTKNSGCHIYYVKKGWAKIVSGKVKGFVKASYLTMDEAAEELAKKVGRECVEIQTDSLRVRALPSTTAPIYSVVSEGEEFAIKKSNVTLDYVKEVVKKQKISNL